MCNHELVEHRIYDTHTSIYCLGCCRVVDIMSNINEEQDVGHNHPWWSAIEQEALLVAGSFQGVSSGD